VGCLVQIPVGCVLRRPTFAQIGLDRSDKPSRPNRRLNLSGRNGAAPPGIPTGPQSTSPDRRKDQPVVDGTVIVPSMMPALAFSRSGTMSSLLPPDVA